MSITGAIVLYPIIWFLCLFIYLPQRIQTQEEQGEVSLGTPRSAPSKPQFRAKTIRTTITATIVWVIICGFVLSLEYFGIGIEEIDFFNRWGKGYYG